jgi:hypothetical protein
MFTEVTCSLRFFRGILCTSEVSTYLQYFVARATLIFVFYLGTRSNVLAVLFEKHW